MNSPIVVFLLGSPNYFPGSKNRFEAVRVRSRGGNLTSVGNVFGVGKNRANQLVFHGIAELRRLIEFDLQFRKHGDLAGPLDSHCKFIANGLRLWLSRRDITTWGQLADSAIEVYEVLPEQNRVALSNFLIGLRVAALQEGFTVCPVLQNVIRGFGHRAP